VGRSYKTDAIVLRSLRLGEADRVLHLYTRDRGRVAAVAKGVRRTRSRFGARLEPLTRVGLVLHEGRGELHTVSGADILVSHHAVREHPGRLAAGQAAAETVGRLFAEGEPSPKAYAALCRLLEVLEERDPVGDAELEPSLLAFQLKLHWVAGFAPQLAACASCGAADVPLVRFSAPLGGAICAGCETGLPLSPAALAAVSELLARPLDEAPALSAAVAAEVARVVRELHEHHGGFRLRTLRPVVAR
jgi:DNA repair protein RecO (recombination protein O)